MTTASTTTPSAMPGPNEWTELQICDAISCTRLGQPLPPHMGVAVETAVKTQAASSATTIRIPWGRWMRSQAKNHFVASIGEFTGTTMFLFLAFAATEIVKDNPYPIANEIIKLLYISIAFGFSLMVNAWIFFRISGALFNPAVTLAMLLVGAVGPLRALCLVVAQLAGSVAASAMVWGMFPVTLSVNTELDKKVSLVRGVWIEAFLTAELIFTILMLAKEKHRSTYMAPVGIGLALFVTQLVGVFYTGGSVNPARSFGPALVTGHFEGYHWIYWVGPFLGALIAVAFYKFIKLLEYEMANPGQDADKVVAPVSQPAPEPAPESSEQARRRPSRVIRWLGLDPFLHGEKEPDEERAVEAPRADAGTARTASDSVNGPPSLRLPRKTQPAAKDDGEAAA